MTIQLHSIRDKVRLILERANHPNRPQAEAETALSLAYRLMQKYDLDENEISKNAGKLTENVKIGMVNNQGESGDRLKGHQTANPRDLVLHHVVETRAPF